MQAFVSKASDLQKKSQIGNQKTREASSNKSISDPIRISSLSINSKLNIGQPGDKFEREADRMADLITNAPPSYKTNENVINKSGDDKREIKSKPQVTIINRREENELQKQEEKKELQKQEEKKELQKQDEKIYPPGREEVQSKSQITDISRQEEKKEEIQKQEEKKEEIQKEEKKEETQAKFQITNINKQEEKKQVQTKLQLQEEEKEQAQAKIEVQNQDEKNQDEVQKKEELQTKPDKKKAGIKYIVNINEPEQKPKEEVQRKSYGSVNNSQPSASGFESTLASSTSGGSQLSSGTRSFMESNLNADFSGVRIHTDSTAAQMSSQINAQAFTHGNNIYFNEGKYNPDSSEGKNLLAHELTHTIQQGVSVQKRVTNDVQKKSNQTTTAKPMIQRSWWGDAWDAVSDVASSAVEFVSEGLEAGLNFIKDKFHDFVVEIPGYKLLSVILGQDPVSGNPVTRNGMNFIIAGLDIIPFGGLFKRKLEETGALAEAAAWLDIQIEGIDISLTSIKEDIEDFWDSLSLSDVGNPNGVLERAANIIRRPIGQIITFAGNVATEFLRIVKNYVLTQLSLHVKNTRGYPLLCVILEKDPITDEPVERNGMNLIRGFMLLSADGEEQLRQMQESGSLQRAADWIDTAVAELNLSWETIKALFSEAWDLVTIENLMSPISTFQQIVSLFAAPVGRIITFVIKVALQILKFIKDALLRRLSAFAHETSGFHLITVILSKDPFTGERVPRTPENVIRGFMSLMEGGEEQFQQMKQTGAIARTLARINAAVETLGFTWEYITGLFKTAWESFSLHDLAAPLEAFTRLVRLFADPIRRLFAFVWEILKIVIEVLLAIMRFPTDLIRNIITKAMQAINDIKRDPIGFLKNILRAIKQGFIQFFDNILQHLIFGVTGWLFGELREAGVNPPPDFTFKSVLGFVLEVLGITMDKIWKKLAEKIGQDKVDRIRGMLDQLEGIWKFIKDVYTRGPVAIWEYVVEKLSNLWDTVLESVRNWVITKIVEKVVTKLLSMLDPTGIMAVVNSVIAIYRAIESFMKYLRQMLEIVNSFVEGVAEIARGNIRVAANFIENAMHRAMPVIIGFLANQVGLGGIGRKVGEMIEKIREKVDGAIGWLIDKAMSMGRAFLDMLRSGAAAVRGGVARLVQWWTKKRKFNVGSEKHEIFFKGDKIYVKSAEQEISELIANHRTAVSALQGRGSGATAQAPSAVYGDAVRREQALIRAKKAASSSMRTEQRAQNIDESGLTSEQAEDFNKLIEDVRNLMTSMQAASPHPNSKIEYKSAQGELGKNTTAEIITIKPDPRVAASTPSSSVNGDVWKEISKRRFYYERAHLISRHFHGSGNKKENIAPIERTANNDVYEREIEQPVKTKVWNEGLIVRLDVRADYGGAKPALEAQLTKINGAENPYNAQQKTAAIKIIENEKKLPDRLIANAWVIEPSPDGRSYIDKTQFLSEKPVENIFPVDLPQIGQAEISNTPSLSRSPILDLIDAGITRNLAQISANAQKPNYQFTSYADYKSVVVEYLNTTPREELPYNIRSMTNAVGWAERTMDSQVKPKVGKEVVL